MKGRIELALWSIVLNEWIMDEWMNEWRWNRCFSFSWNIFFLFKGVKSVRRKLLLLSTSGRKSEASFLLQSVLLFLTQFFLIYHLIYYSPKSSAQGGSTGDVISSFRGANRIIVTNRCPTTGLLIILTPSLASFFWQQFPIQNDICMVYHVSFRSFYEPKVNLLKRGFTVNDKWATCSS